MDLQKLSKRERFYFDVGDALSMTNHRCFINQETLEVEIHASEYDYEFSGVEDTALETLENPEKFMPVEPVSTREAFRVIASFVEIVTDTRLQQRLTDALNGRKPFANFNHLVHTTNVREQWFDFKNKTYAELAKEWIEKNAGDELKEKIKDLPAVSIT